MIKFMRGGWIQVFVGMFLASLAITGPAQASLITESIQNTNLVNFSQFDYSNPDGSASNVFGKGPVEVGGLVGISISFLSNNDGAVMGNGPYGLGSNGKWDAGRKGFVGVNGSGRPGEWIQITFNNGLVSMVGGFINYAICDSLPCYPQQDFVLEALDINGIVLESYNVSELSPISTPGETNSGAFRGIQRTSSDIHALRLNQATNALDDLEFFGYVGEYGVPGTIPEPETYTLMLLSLGLLGLTTRRRRQKLNA